MKSTETSFEVPFEALRQTVANLRGPTGCPWDKEQTPQSLTPYILEEAYELVEALESGTKAEIIDELGDFLFQVFLQIQIASESESFTWREVLENLNAKLIRRHPHVFADAKWQTTEEVWKNWHKQKAEESAANANSSASESKHLVSVSKNLPSLQRANKIGIKSSGISFDWDGPEAVYEKVEEELQELREAMDQSKNATSSLEEKSKLEHEIGDLLFSVCQLARHLKIDPEVSLRAMNRRFLNRLDTAFQLSQVSRDQFVLLPAETKESLWQQAKAQEK